MGLLQLTEEQAEACATDFGCNRIEPRRGVDGKYYVPTSVLLLSELPSNVQSILASASEVEVTSETFPIDVME